MTYAAKTQVPAERSRAEIETLIARHGGRSFGSFAEPGRAVIVFEAHDRRLRFDLPLPTGTSDGDAKQKRVRWRALLLCIKAKLEAVESKIETFEEAFLAHVVLPDGLTVGQHSAPAIARAYSENEMVPLLPSPRKD